MAATAASLHARAPPSRFAQTDGRLPATKTMRSPPENPSQGTFGTVFKVRCRSNGHILCLKRIPLEDGASSSGGGGAGGGGALLEAKVRAGGQASWGTAKK